MKYSRIATFGGACSVLAGIFTLLAETHYFLFPPEQRLAVPGSTLLPSFAQQSTPLSLENLAPALDGVFGLGLAPAHRRMTLDPLGLILLANCPLWVKHEILESN